MFRVEVSGQVAGRNGSFSLRFTVALASDRSESEADAVSITGMAVITEVSVWPSDNGLVSARRLDGSARNHLIHAAKPSSFVKISNDFTHRRYC